MFFHLSELFQALIFVVPVFAAAHAIGRAFPLPLAQEAGPSLRTLMRTGCGALVLSAILFMLASVHFFTARAIYTMQGLCILAVIGEGFRLGQYFFKNQTKVPALPCLVAGIYILITGALLLLPAAEKDEIIYHLEIPRQILLHHGWPLLHDNIYAYFPQWTELFFAMGLSLAGEVAAKSFHFVVGCLWSATFIVFIKRSFARENTFFAALLFMTTPLVMVMLSWAYVDLAFSWFALLAWIAAQESLRNNSRAWLAFAGLFCGAAASVKYTGIQLTGIFAVWILMMYFWKGKRRAVFRDILWFCLPAGLVFLPYLIRNYILTGWPLYPFRTAGFILKPGFNWDAQRAQLYLSWIKTFGAPLEASALDFWLAPLRVFTTFQFEDPLRFGGVLGPVYLLIPFLFATKKMKEIPRGPVLFCGLYFYFWMCTTRQTRFLLPLLPFLVFLLVWGLARLPRRITLTIVSVTLCFNLYVFGAETFRKKPFDYLTGRETRQDYLLRQHRVYAMLSAANKIVPPDKKIYLLQMKNYGYFINRDWTGDFIFERYRLERLLKTQPNVNQIAAFFKEQDTNYLLVDQVPLRDSLSGLTAEMLVPFDQFLATCKPIAFKGGMGLYEII